MAQGDLYKQYSVFAQRAGALYAKPEIRASLEIILSVFTVTLLIFFAIRPTLTNVASLQKKIEDQEVVLKKADTKVSQLLSAETQLSENQGRLALLVDAVPDNFNYFNISKRVEIVAREASVTLSLMRLPGSIVLGGPDVPGLVGDRAKEVVMPDENGVMMIGVQFNVGGGQEQVLNFMRSLENMDLLAVIQNIKISKTTTSGTGAGLDLEGRAWFYSFRSAIAEADET